MVYLWELLRKLSEEEIERLRSLPVTEVEARIFEYVRAACKQKLPSTKVIAASLDISPGHLRKAGSLLLRKYYDHLAPDGPKALILFLSQRLLHNQAKHEIKKQEAYYLKKGDASALSAYYFDVMPRMMNDEVSNYDFNFIDHLVASFERLNPGDDVMNAAMRLQRLSYQMTYASSKPPASKSARSKQLKAFKASLDACKELLQSSNEPIGKFWLHYNYYGYYDIERRQFAERLHHILLASEIAKAHPELFSQRIYLGVLCKVAIVYYDESRLEEAHQYFKTIFETYADEMRGGRYFADMYAQCSIALGDYQTARRILCEYHAIDPTDIEETMGNNFGPVTVLAQIDLLEDRFDDAYPKIQAAHQIIDKSTYIILEALLRGVETGYYFLTEDYGTTADLIQKNLKFCHYHKEKQEAQLFKQYFTVLKHLLQSVAHPKPLSGELNEYYSTWLQGDLAFAGKLLEKIYNKVLHD